MIGSVVTTTSENLLLLSIVVCGASTCFVNVYEYQLRCIAYMLLLLYMYLFCFSVWRIVTWVMRLVRYTVQQIVMHHLDLLSALDVERDQKQCRPVPLDHSVESLATGSQENGKW